MKGILVELPLIYFFWEVQIQKLGTEIYDQQVPDGTILQGSKKRQKNNSS